LFGILIIIDFVKKRINERNNPPFCPRQRGRSGCVSPAGEGLRGWKNKKKTAKSYFEGLRKKV